MLRLLARYLNRLPEGPLADSHPARRTGRHPANGDFQILAAAVGPQTVSMTSGETSRVLPGTGRPCPVALPTMREWSSCFQGARGRAPGSNQRGFTLLEILVVIAILGLLIGLVAPAALRQLGGARVSVARQSVERIGSILDLYKLDVGSYPTTEQGLQALVSEPSGISNWNGPYIKGDVPLDPWNRPYKYADPSARPGHDYDLCSEGANGSGGSSEICNP